MSNPIQITVQAQTVEAAAALKQFAQQANSNLQVLSKGVKTLSADAGKASEHIAGMSYYFRSGIDQIRFAMMGGGARAGFYAVDEAVRGLISSGMKLSTLVPVLGALGAAVGAGVLVWHEWNKAEDDAIKKAQDLADAWKELPGLIKQIADMQQAGLLGPGAAAHLADVATGRKKLYMTSEGQPTFSPTEQLFVQGAGSLPTMGGVPSGGSLQTFPNREAEMLRQAEALQKQEQERQAEALRRDEAVKQSQAVKPVEKPTESIKPTERIRERIKTSEDIRRQIEMSRQKRNQQQSKGMRI